ncbi:hypothetical protein GCM10022232_37140 [Streptomyces plumbiresistens]|uniref:Uncharacterized protein n=1 Tax=Streptomyces plumbiresistens TaxID=511811 RepID=A0ABP7RFI9_9ACTN
MRPAGPHESGPGSEHFPGAEITGVRAELSVCSPFLFPLVDFEIELRFISLEVLTMSDQRE